MGFLNNTSQTIDAILTKRGRERLGQTGQLNITKFALADDEVDYALWDPSHPNGTNSYGTVIENMPVLEPVQDQSLSLRYKLVTRADEPEKLAFIDYWHHKYTRSGDFLRDEFSKEFEMTDFWWSKNSLIPIRK